MAPGLFCIWSRTDPDVAVTVKPDDETFRDAVTELPGVSLGTQIRQMKGQVMEYPYSHDIPFMTMYDLPDVEYRNDEAFKRVEKACQSRGEGNDNISVVTCETPPPEQIEEFWKWQKETYTPLLLEGPTFLRARILKEVGEERTDSAMPSAPYMWVYEWEDDELPWMELTGAAQSKEWGKLIEGGLIWQGLCYHTKRYSEKFETSLSSSGQEEDGDEESETDSSRNGEDEE
ncbi:hypothetical protein N0V90_003307 [Kalmusia sp. IMI 367209]|nr:hypothetical protein N0V90_003307 [Kalmusia sp. IMI 367209]